MTTRQVLEASLVAGAAALALLAPRDGVAQITHATLRPMAQDKSSVAVAPDGTVHVVYMTYDRHLRHTWNRDAIWRDESVDDISSAGWWHSAAVDSAGRLHVAYHADGSGLGGTGVLAYAVRDGSGWTITDIGPGGWSTSIAIGTGDLPRIFHDVDTTGPRYEVFDGANWTSVETGMSAHYFMGSSLVLDANGAAHATFGTSTQLFYGTNASGTWTAAPLGPGGAMAAIALDGGGRPHVVAAFNSGVEHASLQHLWDDGSGWRSEDVFDRTQIPPNVQLTPDYVSLLSDTDGHLFALVSDFVTSTRGSAELTIFTYFDGVEWRAQLADRRQAGWEVSLARGPDGSFHGTYRKSLRGEHARSLYARIRLPDLSATLGAATATPTRSGSRIHSTVTVGNRGSGTSKPARVTFYLSDDETFDEGDQRVGPALAVRPTAPGRTTSIRVSATVRVSVAGKRLLAVIDAGRSLEDIDRPNNTASATIVQ